MFFYKTQDLGRVLRVGSLFLFYTAGMRSVGGSGGGCNWVLISGHSFTSHSDQMAHSFSMG